MPSFQLKLYDRERAMIGSTRFDVDDPVSALKVASRIFESCYDTCAGYALWQDGTCISSATATAGKPRMDLSGVQQQIVIDTEISLRDSADQIRRSKMLLAALEGGTCRGGSHSRIDANRTYRQKASSGPLSLSARERECMQLAARGNSDREIGKQLDLSEKTVNEYIERVKRKLDAETRVEAVVLALKANLIEA